MPNRSGLGTELRYQRENDSTVVTTVAAVDPAQLLLSRPVRRVTSHAGDRHYCGLFWSATMGRHLPYESRLEHDRLLLADFDPDVSAIAVQPMWLFGMDDGVVRRHVPDLLIKRDRGLLVVDVKPRELAGRPEAAAVFSWTGRVCAARGWGYEVWSEPDVTVLSNVRTLAQVRRRTVVDDAVLRAVSALDPDGRSVGDLAAAIPGCPPASARRAVLHLLWRGTWRCELSTPLSDATSIERRVAA